MNSKYSRSSSMTIQPSFIDEENEDELECGKDLVLKHLNVSEFNEMQTAMLPYLLESNSNIICSAPTGSGKSLLFEIAILKLYLLSNSNSISKNWVAIVIAPSKALCAQFKNGFVEKFGKPFGIDVHSLTSDTDDLLDVKKSVISAINGFFLMRQSHLAAQRGPIIIVATPEKVESVLRRNILLSDDLNSRDPTSHEQTTSDFYRLIMIDEIHHLGEAPRGAALESIIVRAKKIQKPLRIVGTSATIPNAKEIAEWLNGIPFEFNSSYRACPLQLHCFGYSSFKNSNSFMLNKTLNKHVPEVIDKYSEQKPTLVFCTSRKDAKESAQLFANNKLGLIMRKKFIENQKMNKNECLIEHKMFSQSLEEEANKISDKELAQCVRHGVGYHTAGLSPNDREIIENLFLRHHLPVLTSTSTLAQGINLPAHLVIIKGTSVWRGSDVGMQEIDRTSILQMIGRAGRAGLDTYGVGVIMTQRGNEYSYQNLLSKENGLNKVTSNLNSSIIECVGLEIALGNIINITSARQWFQETFLYHEKITSNTVSSRDFNLIGDALTALERIDCIQIKDDQIIATQFGKLLGYYYIRFENAQPIQDLLTNLTHDDMAFDSIIEKQGKCSLKPDNIRNFLLKLCTFPELQYLNLEVRKDQKKWLNNVAWEAGRFTFMKTKYRVQSSSAKIFHIVQAEISRIFISDQVLKSEASKIFEILFRLLSCLLVYFTSIRPSVYAVYTFSLLRSCETKSWECEKLSQISQVGEKTKEKLESMGIIDIETLSSISTENIEGAIGNKGRLLQISEEAKRLMAQKCIFQLRTETSNQISFIFTPLQNKSKISQAGNYCLFVCIEIQSREQKLDMMLHSYKQNIISTEVIDIDISKYQDSSTSVNAVYFFAFHKHYAGLDESFVWHPKLKHSSSSSSSKVSLSFESPNKRQKIRRINSYSYHPDLVETIIPQRNIPIQSNLEMRDTSKHFHQKTARRLSFEENNNDIVQEEQETRNEWKQEKSSFKDIFML